MRKNWNEYTENVNFYGGHSASELADKFGTPLYVYNERILRKRCRDLKNLSSHAGFKVNYSIKANSNPALLRIIREEGLLADAMSPGELHMDKLAGYEPEQILYISNNNTAEEMRHAISHGCLVSVDSLSQLELFGRLNHGGRVMARINPGIGAGHSAKVITGGANTKFGINVDRLDELIELAQKYELTLSGLNQHIGSLFMRPDSYLDAVRILLDIAAALPENIFNQLEILDFGGGFGIPYHKYEHEARLDMRLLGAGLHAIITEWADKNSYSGYFLVEPGRYVVAECGILLGRATAVKTNGDVHYVGTDIGFNVLQRPVMYGSFHDLEIYSSNDKSKEPIVQTIVGNICESGDILAKDRLLPRLEPDDLLAILDAGAYGFSMASNYNERLLPAEILINENDSVKVIRRRQTFKDLEACLVL